MNVKRCLVQFVLSALACALLCSPKPAAGAMPPQLLQSQSKQAQSADQPALPANLSAAEIEALVARLSDEEVRQLLLEQLRQGALPPAEPALPADDSLAKHMLAFILKADQEANKVIKFFVTVYSSALASLAHWPLLLDQLAGEQGRAVLYKDLLLILVIIAGGLLAAWLILKITADLINYLVQTVPLGRWQHVGHFALRLLLRLLSAAVYGLVTVGLFVLMFQQGDPGHLLASRAMIVSYYVVLILLAARTMLAPHAAKLRPLPLNDTDATFFYRWIARITLTAAVIASLKLVAQAGLGDENLTVFFESLNGLVLTLLLMAMIWRARRRVAEAFCQEDAICSLQTPRLRDKLAGIWYVFAILLVLGMGLGWQVHLMMAGTARVLTLIYSLLIIPLFLAADQWGQRLIEHFVSPAPQTSPDPEDEADQTSEADQADDEALLEASPEKDQPDQAKPQVALSRYLSFSKRLYRALLLATLLFFTLRLWGIDLPLGRLFTETALSILAIMLLAYIAWEYVKAIIDRKIRAEMPEEDEEAEEGGAGGSRIGTLLLLLRKFILAVLLVVVILIILSELGVNIGPLIAGAGVVGLAIGFGAQTLVKDIISGVFFLVDDAFRVGDYVETGSQKGMVEHISLRSLRLRHPRGMVHTIPFGDIGSVTNFSRDYIITKLNFRVKYDTDVDQVRKIIKKINKQFQKDPEYGPKLLGKIKSQGIREMDDSAMIMRVKFKTIPGEQFVIRREVFRRMQEAFQKKGIEFAHRNVTVYLPQDETGPGAGPQTQGPAAGIDPKLIEAGAAAALAAEEREQKAEKPPNPDR